MAIRPADLQLAYLAAPQNSAVASQAQTGPQIAQQASAAAFAAQVREREETVAEAAKLEGANPFQVYLHIYMPLARPALAAFGFLALLSSWNEFFWALTVTNQTDMRVLPVGIALFQGQYFTNIAILLAAANMATFPLLLVFIFFQKQLVEGVSLSGLK